MITEKNVKRIEEELKNQKEDLKNRIDEVNKKFQIHAQGHSPRSGGGVV
jgi:hypothetical protein